MISDRDISVIYEKELNSDCIWLIGGYMCQNCIFCYSISNHSVQLYDLFPNDIYTVRSSPRMFSFIFQTLYSLQN